MKSHGSKYPLGILPEAVPLREEPMEWDYELEAMVTADGGWNEPIPDEEPE